MARRYVFEHVWQHEAPADRLWRSTWKYSILAVYYAGLGVTAGGTLMAVYIWMTW